MTPADAYRRCLFARPNSPLEKVVEAVRQWKDAGLFLHPDKARAYWRQELLILVSGLHDPEDLLAACLVAVEAGVADAGTVWDAAPGGRM